MGLGWLLVPAIAGYWFLTHAHFTRFYALRASGYHLVFRSGAAGGVLVLLAYVVVLGVDYACPLADTIWKKHVLRVEYSGTLFLSAVLGVALPLICNRFWPNEDRAVSQAMERAGDILEQLLAESIKRSILVEISLKSRKVYIGWAVNLKSVHGRTDVAVIPLWSGYRNKDTLELTITTPYAATIDRYRPSDSDPSVETEHRAHSGSEAPPNAETYSPLDDFRVVIPKSEILSARFFDIEIYDQARQGKTPKNSHGGGAGM